MEPSERDVAGIAAWVTAGEALAEVRARELRELTDEQARRAVKELLALLDTLPLKEGGSGLVEQQRVLARLR